MTKKTDAKKGKTAKPAEADAAPKAVIKKSANDPKPVSVEIQHPWGVKAENQTALTMIENSLDMNLNNLHGVNLLQNFVAIRVGLSLLAAKTLIRHGLFGTWLEKIVDGRLSPRTAQDYIKLANIFSNAQNKAAEKRLELPTAADAGMWLMRQGQDNSELAEAVKAFAGNMTITEVMEKHSVRNKKDKGGYQPNNYLLTVYCQQHPEVSSDYAAWQPEEQEAFRTWASEQRASGSAMNTEAASGRWRKMMGELKNQLSRDSYSYLTREDMADVLTTLEGAVVKIKAALDGGAE